MSAQPKISSISLGEYLSKKFIFSKFDNNDFEVTFLYP